MTTPTIVSKSGAPVIQLTDWVATKNDPAITALYNAHTQNFFDGKVLAPLENPAMDAMFNQFFAETNQELVNQ